MGRAFLKKRLDASFEFSAFSLPGKIRYLEKISKVK